MVEELYPDQFTWKQPESERPLFHYSSDEDGPGYHLNHRGIVECETCATSRKATIRWPEAAYPADLAFIRTQTGFEPDSVPPTGHAHPIRAWMDPRLLEFDKVWACAGAPALVFSIDPEALRRLAGAVAGDFTGYWAASS
ncbi:YbaK/prolyl-tRNA synthetase associated region [Salipiger mucosus DSM 16094]|uniref:YbaK/prolyl-tRNA synthetase associated region n=2 Tax=Salipiger mucosus TaxID=263378 RepID=S9QAG8_9RHOB|nr:YbaK/prolyl-tRNA synthetase associated region [Salipiger mucosus DSM 16094]